MVYLCGSFVAAKRRRSARARKTAVPARPFLGLSDANVGGIERTVARQLARDAE